MKKFLTFLLCLVTVFSFAATFAAAEGSVYTPGVYTATATGRTGQVTVTLTVDESSITDVDVDASNETPAIGGRAAETLEEQVLEAQSADIDGVSGATKTSDAVRTAVAEALSKAARDEESPVLDCQWCEIDGRNYWYENGVRQGTYDDANGVIGDGTIRGREIFDPASNGWYWLDACYDGAKAVSKEVWMPYIYQNEAGWDDSEIWSNADASDSGMAQQVHDSIVNSTGKWVRYNANGMMYKGWCKITDSDEFSYCPDQIDNIYYYDTKTGLMAKGWLTIDGKTFHFDETTGVLIQ